MSAVLLLALLIGVPLPVSISAAEFPAAAAAAPPTAGPKYAAEYVWSRDYYLRDDLKQATPEQTRERLDELLQLATDILQDEHREGDVACPVRFVAGRVEFYDLDDARFPQAKRKRGELRFPGVFPGVYVAPGPGPSFSVGDQVFVWVKPDWERLNTSAGWALAHEHGHSAGLLHLDVRRGAPCQLMSYGAFADNCRGGRIVRAFQCTAYQRAAQRIEGVARCLLEDGSRLSRGQRAVYPAPAFTPCSDDSGYCNGRGICIAAHPMCFTPDGPAPAGTDCATSAGECARCTGDGKVCAPCEEER